MRLHKWVAQGHFQMPLVYYIAIAIHSKQNDKIRKYVTSFYKNSDSIYSAIYFKF